MPKPNPGIRDRVVALVVQDVVDGAIAHQLGISVRTVRRHMTAAKWAAGVSGRCGLSYHRGQREEWVLALVRAAWVLYGGTACPHPMVEHPVTGCMRCELATALADVPADIRKAATDTKGET